jgi:hypothetical protein
VTIEASLAQFVSIDERLSRGANPRALLDGRTVEELRGAIVNLARALPRAEEFAEDLTDFAPLVVADARELVAEIISTIHAWERLGTAASPPHGWVGFAPLDPSQ